VVVCAAEEGNDFHLLNAGTTVAFVPPVRSAWLVVAGLFPRVAAADPPALRLGDIVAAAVQGNPALLEAGADVGVAAGNRLAAEGADDFILDGRASFRQDQTALVSGVPVQQPSHRDVNFELDLTRPLPTGGAIGLRLLGDYTRNVFTSDLGNGMTAESTVPQWAPGVQLVWTQPLLRGLGYAAARGALRRAQSVEDASKLTRAAVAATALRDVATAYHELAFATEDLGTRRALAQAAHDQLAAVDANIGAGKMPPSARAEVEVAAGLRDEDVILAEQALLERSLTVRQLSGLHIGPADGAIAAADSLDQPVAIAALEAALAKAEVASPQLVAARANEGPPQIDVEVSENGLLPQLDFSLVAGPVGSALDVGGSLDQVAKLASYTIQASLTLHQALERRAARGASLAARESLRKAQLTEADIRAQLRVAVVRMQSLEAQTQRRLDVLAPAFQAATLDLAAERARFAVGRSTNFDVLRRQEEVASARLRQARARADLLEARDALEAATGEILGRYGVSLR
jgi:outer membrane protein TolC